MMNKEKKIEICNIEEDYEKCRLFVHGLLKKEKVSDTTYNETMLVFETIYQNILKQNKNGGTTLTLQKEKKWGNVCIRIGYKGEMYKAEESDQNELSPEEKIMNAYNDRIDYCYSSEYNRIQITVRHSRGSALIPCLLGIGFALIVYAILHMILDENKEMIVLKDIVYPLEKWCSNLVLMVGTPITFISFVKYLTDIYIMADQDSDLRKLRRAIIRSSIFAVLLALLTGWIIMQIFEDPQIDFQSPMSVDKSLPELLSTLIPSDIFTPFMVMSPFPILILATLVTAALCSVGKYFDRIKKVIDTCYALFSRILSIIMYGLPFFVFLALLDILFSAGTQALWFYIMPILAGIIGILIIGFLYWLRLCRLKVPVRTFTKQLFPLLKENYKIGSVIDATPFNIRYCARTWSMNRKKLESSIPVLAEINLDGNCFFITLIPLVLMFTSNADVTLLNMFLVGMLAFFLSLGAPNQPGSILIGLLIVFNFMQADNLIPNAFIFEVLFGGLLNLVNVTGDIVTVYEMEKEQV